MIIAIIINSIVIAIYDRRDKESTTNYNKQLDKIQFAVTIFFSVEALLKIFSQGLVFKVGSYLRDLWNWVDLFTVILG